MPATSPLYVHYSGFGAPLLFNFISQGETPTNSFSLLAQPPTQPYRQVGPKRNGIYVELPAAAAAEDGDFVCLMFTPRAEHLGRRLDLFLSPSALAKHIHARLIAADSEVLFDGAAPFFDDSKDEPPFSLDHPPGA